MGIIVGIAKIIPGLSGAVLMISFNLYDRAIMAITNFFDDLIDNLIFILEFGLGVGLGIVFFSKLLLFFINNYYLYTVSIFIGLIFGGLFTLIKNFNKSNINYMVISFIVVIILSINSINYVYQVNNSFVDIVIFFIAGVLEALGTVVPGISSTALLMLIGVYSYYIEVVSNILSISLIKDNLLFFIPFSLGLFGGVIGISFIVSYLFKYYKDKTFSVIFGFSLASLFILIIKIIPYIRNIGDVIVSILLFVLGCFIASRF